MSDELLAHLKDQIGDLNIQNLRLKAQVAYLKEILGKRGRHDMCCAVTRWGSRWGNCDCGLDAALGVIDETE